MELYILVVSPLLLIVLIAGAYSSYKRQKRGEIVYFTYQSAIPLILAGILGIIVCIIRIIETKN